MGRLRHGTSSFSEKSWVGPFYPEGTRAADFLTAYAQRFDAVEIDATYYAVPSPETVDGWRRKVPGDFRVCAKFPRAIVHAGAGPQPDAGKVLVAEHVAGDSDAFLTNIARLGECLGPLVLQFPYFNRDCFADAEEFLARLDTYLGTLPREHRYAVELRNKAWLDVPLLEVLRRHDAALVLVDLPYMPHPEELGQRLDLVTTDFSYVRLIGDRKAVDERTSTFDRIVLDQRPRLRRWARLIRDLLQRVGITWAFANNHFAGHGPATIRELVEMIAEERADD